MSYKEIKELADKIEGQLWTLPNEDGVDVNAANLVRHATAIVQEVSRRMENPNHVDAAYIDEKIKQLQIDLEWFINYRKGGEEE